MMNNKSIVICIAFVEIITVNTFFIYKSRFLDSSSMSDILTHCTANQIHFFFLLNLSIVSLVLGNKFALDKYFNKVVLLIISLVLALYRFPVDKNVILHFVFMTIYVFSGMLIFLGNWKYTIECREYVCDKIKLIITYSFLYIMMCILTYLFIDTYQDDNDDEHYWHYRHLKVKKSLMYELSLNNAMYLNVLITFYFNN